MGETGAGRERRQLRAVSRTDDFEDLLEALGKHLVVDQRGSGHGRRPPSRGGVLFNRQRAAIHLDLMPGSGAVTSVP